MLDRTKPIPLYYQLRELILDKIQKGEWKAGDQVPGERELSDQFGISRMTVRQALKDLERIGRLTSYQGKGTYVSQQKIDQSLFTVTGFSEDMENRGIKPTTQVLSVKKERASGRAAELFQVKEMLIIERLRLANEEPVAIEISHFPLPEFDFLLDRDLTKSLYSMLRAKGQLFLYAEQSIEAAPLPKNCAKVLKVAVNSPALILERISYNLENRPIEYVHSYYRGDRYKLWLTLKGESM